MSITSELREYAHDCCARVDDAIHAIADRIDAEHEEALLNVHTDLMDASGWVRLPKDVDGKAWHIGDRTESGQTIEAMGLNKYGWHFVGTVNEIDPSIHRHYHAPTVEDVLREFANEVYADADNEIRDRDFLCAKYAKRLTLAEGEDA